MTRLSNSPHSLPIHRTPNQSAHNPGNVSRIADETSKSTPPSTLTPSPWPPTAKPTIASGTPPPQQPHLRLPAGPSSPQQIIPIHVSGGSKSLSLLTNPTPTEHPAPHPAILLPTKTLGTRRRKCFYIHFLSCCLLFKSQCAHFFFFCFCHGQHRIPFLMQRLRWFLFFFVFFWEVGDLKVVQWQKDKVFPHELLTMQMLRATNHFCCRVQTLFGGFAKLNSFSAHKPTFFCQWQNY